MSDPDTSKIIKKEEIREDAQKVEVEGEIDHMNWFKGKKGQEAKRDLDKVFGFD